jgi:hypothetical protein
MRELNKQKFIIDEDFLIENVYKAL